MAPFYLYYLNLLTATSMFFVFDATGGWTTGGAVLFVQAVRSFSAMAPLGRARSSTEDVAAAEPRAAVSPAGPDLIISFEVSGEEITRLPWELWTAFERNAPFESIELGWRNLRVRLAWATAPFVRKAQAEMRNIGAFSSNIEKNKAEEYLQGKLLEHSKIVGGLGGKGNLAVVRGRFTTKLPLDKLSVAGSDRFSSAYQLAAEHITLLDPRTGRLVDKTKALGVGPGDFFEAEQQPALTIVKRKFLIPDEDELDRLNRLFDAELPVEEVNLLSDLEESSRELARRNAGGDSQTTTTTSGAGAAPSGRDASQDENEPDATLGSTSNSSWLVRSFTSHFLRLAIAPTVDRYGMKMPNPVSLQQIHREQGAQAPGYTSVAIRTALRARIDAEQALLIYGPRESWQVEKDEASEEEDEAGVVAREA
ncbi:unnamed protein product [Amoebophrya sp. A120]|nr:unnamed protein product [Amoebophrya sp. A120]|eukprot:GSA120T00022291001.1